MFENFSIRKRQRVKANIPMFFSQLARVASGIAVTLALTGCVGDLLKLMDGGRKFEDDDERYATEALPPDATKVTWRHMRCCYDLCKRQEPESVRKEPNSPYIICECKTGKRFRVTKLENKPR